MAEINKYCGICNSACQHYDVSTDKWTCTKKICKYAKVKTLKEAINLR